MSASHPDPATRSSPPGEAGAAATADHFTGLPNFATAAGPYGSADEKDSAAPPAFASPDERYVVLEFLARGGMGEVFTARDRALNRDIAIKLLRPDLKNRSSIESRFVEEARITGQLQHPGIPPIHDLGTFRDGRPFIAMKLIKGRTLSDRLANDPPPLAELLRIFEEVCQAVAYAHGLRVIHRDLKPGNVMVGRFNEVQVMDWGLAKVLGESPPEADSLRPEEQATMAASVVESDRDPSSQTRAGSLLGTPAYMPPEQAKGEIARIDTRADVFALGAILCELLTGKPPYWADSSAEVQALSLTGQLGPALERLDAASADRELVSLAKHCLALMPEERPADASEVARAIADYRAGVEDRLRQAERDRAAAEARAAEELNTRREAEARAAERRQRRLVQLALLAAVVMLIAVAAVARWTNESRLETVAALGRESQARRETADALAQLSEMKKQSEAARATRNAAAIEALLTQCETALQADDAERAGLAFDQIGKRTGEGGAEQLVERIERCRRDLALSRALDQAEEILWTIEDYKTRSLEASAAWDSAFKSIGIDIEETRPADAARKIKDSLIRERLLTALDLWHINYPANRSRFGLRRIIDAADPDPFRDEVRNALGRADRPWLESLGKDPNALRQPPRFAVILGQAPFVKLVDRQQILRRAVERSPGDFSLLITLAKLYEGNTEFRSETLLQQFRWSQAAVAVRPKSKVAWRHIARALWDQGKLDEAGAAYRVALRLDPNDPYTLTSYTALLLRKADPDAAMEIAQRAVQVKPEFSTAHNNLGSVHDRRGDRPRALEEFQKAVDLDAMNGVESHLHMNNLGYALLRNRDFDRAMYYFREAIRIKPDFSLAQANLNHAMSLKRGIPPHLAPPPREVLR